MLELTKELLKETIVLLVTVNVIWFLIPRWIRNGIKRFNKLVYKGGRGMTRYAKKHYRTYYKQHKKATPKVQEQPSNIVTIIYPNGTIKQYPRAK